MRVGLAGYGYGYGYDELVGRERSVAPDHPRHLTDRARHHQFDQLLIEFGVAIVRWIWFEIAFDSSRSEKMTPEIA
jgi:hypothetical protein